MENDVLHLFPDTNLFMQCKPLEELKWETWSNRDEVHLIVSRPVQAEIDKHKNRGGDRQSRKARSAAGLLRELITGNELFKVIRDTGPHVRLYVRPDLRFTNDLADRLNYSERDDQLVGIVAAFIGDNDGIDARVLTHDGGPMAMAKMVGVPFVAIPDSWLLPPELSESEKTNAILKAEIDRLKRTEPDFEIVCHSPQSEKVERLDLEELRFTPLEAGEVAALIERIKTAIPMVTDFRPADALSLLSGRTFVPPTAQAIASYQSEKYPTWLSECERVLASCHHSLTKHRQRPRLTFAITNRGSRPGENVLIEVAASGQFEVMPRDKNNATKGDESLTLPTPPVPPAGSYRSIAEMFSGNLVDFDPLSFRRMGVSADILQNLGKVDSVKRDPTRFYWVPTRPKKPAKLFALECERWQHGLPPEHFSAEIWLARDTDSVSGLIECRVHAANLSTATTLKVPLRVEPKTKSAHATAEALVEDLISNSH